MENKVDLSHSSDDHLNEMSCVDELEKLLQNQLHQYEEIGTLHQSLEAEAARTAVSHSLNWT